MQNNHYLLLFHVWVHKLSLFPTIYSISRCLFPIFPFPFPPSSSSSSETYLSHIFLCTTTIHKHREISLLLLLLGRPIGRTAWIFPLNSFSLLHRIRLAAQHFRSCVCGIPHYTDPKVQVSSTHPLVLCLR